jgi:hypothetical protein
MVLEYSDLYSVQHPDATVISCTPEPACTSSTTCTSSSCTSNNSCYQYEYCKNKEKAQALINGKQLSQLQENRDIHLIYEGDYIKSINLMIGIIGVFSFIFYNK